MAEKEEVRDYMIYGIPLRFIRKRKIFHHLSFNSPDMLI